MVSALALAFPRALHISLIPNPYRAGSLYEAGAAVAAVQRVGAQSKVQVELVERYLDDDGMFM